MNRIFHSCLLVLIAALCPLAAEVSINARFNPEYGVVGQQQLRYIVTITESSTDSMPELEALKSLPILSTGGLELRNAQLTRGEQGRYNINGNILYQNSMSAILDVVAPGAGSYTIPSYTLTYKGNEYTVPAATLQLRERRESDGPTIDEMLFIDADFPETLYLGERRNITLRLHILDGVRASRDLRFDRTAAGFTVSDLPEASSESQQRINGRIYRVLTWQLDVTPIRQGPQAISFSMLMDVQLPTERSRSPLGFSSFFGGRTERVNLFTEPAEIQILPLPSTGQPANFSGAVGDFSTEIFTDVQKTTVGEPIMLSLKVVGSGNFDRIQGPQLNESIDWKVYPPQELYEADSDTPLAGMKRFDYVLIPKRAGKLKIPELNFAFFDPKRAEFISSASPQIQIEVEQSAYQALRPSNASQTTPVNQTPDRLLSKPLSAEETLLIPTYRQHKGRSIDSNPLQEPLYYILNSLVAISLCGLIIWLRQQQVLRADPHYELVREASRALKRNLQRCATADVDEFYTHAMNALRQAATKRSRRNLLSADVTQLAALIKDPSLQDQLLDFFKRADAQRFSQHENSSAADDLAAARQRLLTLIKAL